MKIRIPLLVAFAMALPFIVQKEAKAWGPAAHSQLATAMLQNPEIAAAVVERHLNPAEIIYYAAEADLNMPDAWSSWGDMETEAAFQRTWLTDSGRQMTNRSVGYLIHALGDNSVPLSHHPAGTGSNPLIDKTKEAVIEAFVEQFAPLQIFPTTEIYLSRASNVSSSEYWNQYLGAFRKEVEANRETCRGLLSRMSAHAICLACPPPPLPSEPSKWIKRLIFPWYPNSCWHCTDALGDAAIMRNIAVRGWKDSLKLANMVLLNYLRNRN